MKSMIIGAGGQLGIALSEIFTDAMKVHHSHGNSHYNIDITDAQSLTDLITGEEPDVIINVAALANVEECEANKGKAYDINGTGVWNIVSASASIGARLIHISTDYVFGGESRYYAEDAVPDPVNYYGLSKLIGDIYSLSYGKSLIIRTSGVFGVKNNFPVYAYKTLREGKRLNVVDSHYSPIHASLLAKAITHLIDKREKGILNIAGDRISRVGLAEKICEVYGFDRSNINVVPESTMNWKARRPKDSSLDISRAKELIGFDFHSTEANVKELSHSLP